MALIAALVVVLPLAPARGATPPGPRAATAGSPAHRSSSVLGARTCTTYKHDGDTVYKHCHQQLDWHGQVLSDRVNLCVRWAQTGKFRWNIAGNRSRGWTWRGFRFTKPVIRFRGYTVNGCTSPVETRKKIGAAAIHLRSWGNSSFSCDLNPSLSVSAPFGVSISSTPSCGDNTRRLAWDDSLDPDGGRNSLTFFDNTPAKSYGYSGMHIYSGNQVCFHHRLPMKIASARDTQSFKFLRSVTYCLDPTPPA